jgi:hypothetical protein
MGSILLTTTLLGFICITITICLLWVPLFLMKNRPLLTRAEFLSQYPRFYWLNWYFVFMLLLFIGVVILFVIYLNRHPAAELLIVFVSLPALFLLPDGLLTASTGIYRKKKYPLHRNVNYYIYDPQLRIIGYIQVVISLSLILAAVVLTAIHS